VADLAAALRLKSRTAYRLVQSVHEHWPLEERRLKNGGRGAPPLQYRVRRAPKAEA